MEQKFSRKSLPRIQIDKDCNYIESIVDSEDKTKPIIYTHLTTIEKPKENYESLKHIILLLYDYRIKHFSLIPTDT